MAVNATPAPDLLSGLTGRGMTPAAAAPAALPGFANKGLAEQLNLGGARDRGAKMAANPQAAQLQNLFKQIAENKDAGKIGEMLKAPAAGLAGAKLGKDVLNKLAKETNPAEVQKILEGVSPEMRALMQVSPTAAAAAMEAQQNKLPANNYFAAAQCNVSPLRSAEDQKALEEAFQKAPPFQGSVVQISNDGRTSDVKLSSGAQIQIPPAITPYGVQNIDASARFSIERVSGHGDYVLSIFTTVGGQQKADRVFIPAALANQVTLVQQAVDGSTSAATISQLAKVGNPSDIAAAKAIENHVIPPQDIDQRFLGLEAFAQQQGKSVTELLSSFKQNLSSMPLQQVLLGEGKLSDKEPTVAVSQSPILDSSKIQGSMEFNFGKFPAAHIAALKAGLSGPLSDSIKQKLDAISKGERILFVALKATENMVELPTYKATADIKITNASTKEFRTIPANTMLTKADAVQLSQMAKGAVDGDLKYSVEPSLDKTLKPMKTYVRIDKHPFDPSKSTWGMMHVDASLGAQVIATASTESSLFTRTATDSPASSEAKPVVAEAKLVDTTMPAVSDKSFSPVKAEEHSLSSPNKLSASDAKSFWDALPTTITSTQTQTVGIKETPGPNTTTDTASAEKSGNWFTNLFRSKG